MAQKRVTDEISCWAAASLAAYVVVQPNGLGANYVALHDTSTAYIRGVTQDQSVGATGTSVLVAIGGTLKVLCGASVSAGALCAVQTATGYAVEAVASILNTTTTVIPRTLGLAVQAGSTNAIIELDFKPNNISKVAYA